MARFESSHSFLIRGAEAFLRLEIGLVSVPEESDDFPAHRAYVGKPEEWGDIDGLSRRLRRPLPEAGRQEL
jgi:hypothetical protein